jgi:hypothetical protein
MARAVTTETLDTVDPERLDADQSSRAVEIADAIQAAVSARPDLAASVVGIGLDALSSGLRNDPDSILGMAGWVRLASDVFGYVLTGEATDDVDRLRLGDLGL